MARTISNIWTKTRLSAANWCKAMGHGPYVKAADGAFCSNCLRDKEDIEKEIASCQSADPSTTHN
jgi:hypothetical protein